MGFRTVLNDLACDIRDHYHELIEDGVDDAEASRQTVAKYQGSLDDPDDGTCAILALAIGHRDPEVTARIYFHRMHGGDAKAAKAWELQ